MADYKIGQQFMIKSDLAWNEEYLEDETVVKKKGAKCIVGADHKAHYEFGAPQKISPESSVYGYDVNGIAEWITQGVIHFLPRRMLDEWDISDEQIAKVVKEYVEDIFG